jgi:hypothetical protein
MNKIYQNGKMNKLNIWLDTFKMSIALVVSQLLVVP